uniref:Uncharacterized protein n=1 Tax=Aegilops tauschii subsp. strangulata TaxID=200361 RepID=A0A453Q491_AEGTS
MVATLSFPSRRTVSIPPRRPRPCLPVKWRSSRPTSSSPQSR